MVKAVFRICPLDLMMKSVHFQVKKRLSHEVQKVIVELSSVIGQSAMENLAEHQHQGRTLSMRLVR